tara:strand:- start:1486 stop:2106 length:621 start_codon:yes stop_codon:yes gene_type:complete
MSFIKNTQKNYYQISLTGSWNNNNQIVFQVPPLQANTFTSPNISCLGKIRRVFWGKTNSPTALSLGEWGVVGSATAYSGDAGLRMRTNIPTSNKFVIGTDTTNPRTSENGTTMLSCVLEPTRNSVWNGTAVIRGNNIGQSYNDFSDIKDSGVICGNPFGSSLVITFHNPLSIDSENLVPVFDNAGTYQQQTQSCATIELEFMILED